MTAISSEDFDGQLSFIVHDERVFERAPNKLLLDTNAFELDARVHTMAILEDNDFIALYCVEQSLLIGLNSRLIEYCGKNTVLDFVCDD